MRDMSTTNWGTRIKALGYTLQGSVTDNIGRTWKYRAAPDGCGVVPYFDSLGDLVRWVKEVEEARFMVEHPERHALGVELGIFKRDPNAKPLPHGEAHPKAYHGDPLAKSCV